MTWPTDDLTVASLDSSTDDPSQAAAELYRLLVRLNEMILSRGGAGGVCDTDGDNRIPMSRLITGANGLAVLNASGRVPASQIPTGAGAPILLDAAGRVPQAQEPFVCLDAPQLITSSPVAGSWQTVSFSTLQANAARAAWLNIELLCSSTARMYAQLFLRRTGSGLANNSYTLHAGAHANSDGSYTGRGSSVVNAIIDLNGSSQFDYFWNHAGTVNTTTCAITLVGYWT